MYDITHFNYWQLFSQIPQIGTLSLDLFSSFLVLFIALLDRWGKLFAEFFFRLQEAILTIPRGLTRLMDMLMDREVSK